MHTIQRPSPLPAHMLLPNHGHQRSSGQDGRQSPGDLLGLPTKPFGSPQLANYPHQTILFTARPHAPAPPRQSIKQAIPPAAMLLRHKTGGLTGTPSSLETRC